MFGYFPLLLCVVGNREVLSFRNDGMEMNPSRPSNIWNRSLNSPSSLINKIIEKIMAYIMLIFTKARVLGSDFFIFLTSSDDTRVVCKRDANSEEEFKDDKYGDSKTLGQMLSSAFMLPFKVIFRKTQQLPIGAIFRNNASFIPYLIQVKNSSLVQYASNITHVVIDAASDRLWDFSAANLFPHLDKVIMNLKNTNICPNIVIKYLVELQTLYHILLFLGAA